MSAEPSLTRRGAATRERLLEAAEAELVARDGVLEVASVAARADVSVGLLYRYFGSKAGLVAAVVEGFYDRFMAEAADTDPAPGADWASRERARLELSVAFHYREPMAAVVLSRLSREPEVAVVEVRRIERLVEDAAKNVTAGQRRGELPAGHGPADGRRVHDRRLPRRDGRGADPAPAAGRPGPDRGRVALPRARRAVHRLPGLSASPVRGPGVDGRRMVPRAPGAHSGPCRAGPPTPSWS